MGILIGIIKAQIDDMNKSYENLGDDLRPIIRDLVSLWKKIFSLAKSIKMHEPLTTKILSNPDHDFVKLILYIYSMQTFIYKEMNLASRTKDLSKIEFYGPFASALVFIIHSASS